jgi:bifunctional enzyme CysN/CysC
VLPSGATTTITSVDALDSTVEMAVPPMSVAVTLADRLDVGRGDMLVSAEAPPTATRDLECTACWMGEEPLRVGARYALKHTTRIVRATVQALLERTDPETLAVDAEPASLGLNDIGRIVLRTSAVILAESYEAGRMTGAFILIDEHTNDTVGAGLVLEARPVETADRPRRDITWHRSGLDRRERWSHLRQQGGTVLLTGLSGSGKSTIACELERTLVRAGRSAYLLDGDNIRHGLSADLGFSDPDRAEHVRRVGQVARLFADAGTVAVVSLIAPRAVDRDDMRRAHAEAGLPFVEVFVDTPIAECERRDPKGLYARARAGHIVDFTGVSAPYEPPSRPDVHVETVSTDLGAAVDVILDALAAARPAGHDAR